MRAKPKRLDGIKSLASLLGSGTHSNERHVHQFQLASLELERARRTREREATVRHIAGLDARLVEIDGHIRRHLDALGLKAGEASGKESGSTRSCNQEPTAERPRVLRY
jgi:hypothetical protein